MSVPNSVHITHFSTSPMLFYLSISLSEVTVYPKSINNNDDTENSMFAFDMFLWVNNNPARCMHMHGNCAHFPPFLTSAPNNMHAGVCVCACMSAIFFVNVLISIYSFTMSFERVWLNARTWNECAIRIIEMHPKRKRKIHAHTYIIRMHISTLTCVRVTVEKVENNKRKRNTTK